MERSSTGPSRRMSGSLRPLTPGKRQTPRRRLPPGPGGVSGRTRRSAAPLKSPGPSGCSGHRRNTPDTPFQSAAAPPGEPREGAAGSVLPGSACTGRRWSAWHCFAGIAAHRDAAATQRGSLAALSSGSPESAACFGHITKSNLIYKRASTTTICSILTRRTGIFK